MAPVYDKPRPDEAKRRKGFDWNRFGDDLRWVSDWLGDLLELLFFWV